MTEKLYQLKITATGEVRDAEGNLLNQTPIESVEIVTESELKARLEGEAS